MNSWEIWASLLIWFVVIIVVISWNWAMHEAQVRIKNRARRKIKWRPPFMCRHFGHLWVKSEHVLIESILGKFHLEICDRCEGGRVREMLGYSHYHPSAVREYLEAEKTKTQGEETGKLLRLRTE